MSRILSLIFILLVFRSGAIQAQSDFLLHAHTLSPHQLVVNPSVMPDADFYLGLPFVGNSFAGFSNNSFTYRDLIQRKPGTDSIYFNFDSFLSSLREDNFIYAGAVSDLVSIGWREGRWYVGARVSEVVDFRFRFGKDLMRLAVNGNGPYLGEVLQLGNLYLKGSHYRKYAVNVSRDIRCKLRIGVSASWLYGMENINVKQSEISLITDPVTFDLNGTSDILVQTSGLENFNRDSLNSWPYHFQRRNRGLALDLGATYKHSDRLEFSASLLDLGYIRWANQTKVFSNDIQSFSFKGIPVNDFFTTNIDSVEQGFERYLDSLGNIFSIEEREVPRYTTTLPSRFYLSAAYAANTSNTFRMTYLGNSFRKKLYSSLALSYTKNFNDILEFSLLWAYHNRTAANLGAGVTLNLGLTQFNVYADNLPALFGAYTSRGTTLRAGITLVSGYGNERPDFCDRDRDGIPNERDECPDAPGTMEMMGCPDFDLDGIPDKHDNCPDEPGLLNMNGCPDKDGDGIEDKHDGCPELPGPADRGGCPDSDGDGINDDKDKCPAIAGDSALNGCPDRDGDTITDQEDECPDQAGLIAFRGCPDSDNDGLPDNQDECPQTPGEKVYNGCPDTDGDGISDQHDRCPELKGEKSNRGCPSGDADGDGVPDLADACPGVAGSLKNKGCPEVSKVDRAIVETAVQELEFAPGKAMIAESSYESLDNLIILLKKQKELRMRISGHTDNTGSPENNMRLSRDRARAVAIYLISGGVSADRLDIEWFGQTKPIADNSRESGRKRNRRVEMILIQ